MKRSDFKFLITVVLTAALVAFPLSLVEKAQARGFGGFHGGGGFGGFHGGGGFSGGSFRGGSTQHSYGSTSHENAFGGSTYGSYGGGAYHTNAYGGGSYYHGGTVNVNQGWGAYMGSGWGAAAAGAAVGAAASSAGNQPCFQGQTSPTAQIISRGHHGFDCAAFSFITPPNFGSGVRSCLPSIVMAASGEPSTPVICRAWVVAAIAVPALAALALNREATCHNRLPQCF